MDTQYHATYYDAQGRFYSASVILSSITLSIRYRDHNNVQNDVYWLADDIVSLEDRATDSELKYKNREGMIERLIIRDPELVKAIRKHYKYHKFAGGLSYHLLGDTRTKLFLFFGAIVAFIAAGYFFFIPWLGERIAKNVSKEWEISMGEQFYQTIITGYKVDGRKTALLNEFYKSTGFKISYPLRITVVEAKEANAFALPGGHIVVHDEILKEMQRPEELAALLSHEASHISLRHSLRNMFRSMARRVFIMLIVGNESGIATFIIDNADNLKQLEYSRSLETEADNHGMRMMAESGIEPNGMLDLMLLLQKQTKGNEPAAFLSTHPVFTDRVQNVKENMSSLKMGEAVSNDLQTIFSELKSSGTGDW
jgi:Zn-dependent protease with chaperone function